MKHFFLTLTCLLQAVLAAQAQSALNAGQFDEYWKIESESPDYKLTFFGDTLEIVSPKGLTLWRKEKMQGNVTIEYDACVVVENDEDRLSDLNCFWSASDPLYPDNLWEREEWRSGIFANCYSLQLYYLGYGGNYNTTTRFRRYDGNEETKPEILREFTDEAHLLVPNHWYHVKITNNGNKVAYSIDGEQLVDFRDAEPLKAGWFGFRTTLSRTRITNFRSESLEQEDVCVPLKWIGNVPKRQRPVSFGIPFNEGEVTEFSSDFDAWTMAYWPDGSVKWLGLAAVMPPDTLYYIKPSKTAADTEPFFEETESQITVNTGKITAYIPKSGHYLIDSVLCGTTKVVGRCCLTASTQSEPLSETTSRISFSRFRSLIKSAEVERAGNIRTLIKIIGVHGDESGREWLPFTLRLYFYRDSEEIRLVHSFIYDGDQDKDLLNSLGISFEVPMRDELYNRHVAFSCADGGVWSEPVQPLVGRRVLSLGDNDSLQLLQMKGVRIPPYEEFDEKGRNLIDNWAAWDCYRLSQLSSDGFTVRKRANKNNPWIGTFSGTRSEGYAFAGDVSGGLGICMHDFWQSFPSSIEITGAKTDVATLTAWLWSPEAEPMDLRHYDNVAHDLNASYEDVQEGMSNPYGIARTTKLTLLPSKGYHGKEAFAEEVETLTEMSVLLPTPEYLYSRRAFGTWSLPDRSNDFRSHIEDRLDGYIDYYRHAVDEHRWYGFWNYGDFMHAYDRIRHTWRYDIGGYAWDNTELASNLWLWYSFLRTGRADIWKMAEAMTRHTCEVDVYHIGDNAGLGSRHNVSHWGCGAKEARISQAAWAHFYYYLTTDERSGDLMTEVRDADQKLYTLDPMRLAQPRELYPCTAPARLRIGPDWMAYAANWMIEWERTRNNAYRDKILAGMKSICALPNRIFTGPLALGYDPATGVITSECDPTLQTTNHLMTIMGGFEMMNEMMRMIHLPEWEDAWLDYAKNYKQKALEIRNNRFPVLRLLSYAAYHLRSPKLASEAWHDLMERVPEIGEPAFPVMEIKPPHVPAPITEAYDVNTNDAALWSLDAIYMQEVIPVCQSIANNN